MPANRWTHLSHRRLQAHPSTLLKGHTLLASPLPYWLKKPVVDRFLSLGIFADTPHRGPNHVLINEYKRGEGIMPHEDGEIYAPVVATVSLGATICLKITAKSGGQHEDGRDATQDFGGVSGVKIPTRILQEPGSLLITTGAAYRDLLHGIEEVEVDEGLSPETVANWSLLGDAEGIVKNGGRNERSTRTSLTYRDVLKVSTAASRVFGGLGRR
jgi:alkylated DNA repair protein alkB family protein 6